MGKFLFLFIALLSPLAMADEIQGHPGWFLNVSDEAEAFSLQPGDGRAPVAIDMASAEKIKNGEIDPAVLYRSASQSTKKQNEDQVYGAGGTTITQVDAVLSTAPMEYQTAGNSSVSSSENQDHAIEQPTANSGSSLPSITGFNGTGSTSSASRLPASSPSPAPRRPGAFPPAKSPELASALPASDAPSTNAAEIANSSASSVAVNAESSTPILAMSTGNEAKGFGFSGTSSGTSDSDPKSPNYKPPGYNPPCPQGERTFEAAGTFKIPVGRGCSFVFITAWGAGGKSTTYMQSYGRDGDQTRQVRVNGGGGSFVSGSGAFDGTKFDLYVVVGGSGGAHGGGKGGAGSAYDGADGGGYSGVFLASKAGGSTNTEMPLVVAGGGGGAGGGANGEGFRGGYEKGGGNSLGASQSAGGVGSSGGDSGAKYRGGDGADGSENTSSASMGGGGGGGGFFGGAGGRFGGGGGGGSSYSKLQGFFTEPGNKGIGANEYFPDRNHAGDADRPGKVVVKWY